MKKIILYSLVTFLFLFQPEQSLAQKRRAQAEAGESKTTFTYDVSAGAGNYNNLSYNEINLGLNWSLQDWLIWRNALFSRFGSGIDTVSGLDSALRISHSLRSDSGAFGVDAFFGPGLRLANQNSNAVFAEAGLAFKLAGLYLGAGVKSLYYISDRKDAMGNSLSKNDNQYFIIFSGGGAF